jgi:predicted metal-dependent peptidase
MKNREESLAKISKTLILAEPFYGFLLIMLNKIWNKNIVPTAGVSKNGINYQLAINPDFWESLSNEHRYGVLKHELLHIAFFHLTQHHNYSDRKLANIAMDMEINQYIDDSQLPTKELSKEEYDAIVDPIKEEIKKAKERDDVTLEEIMALIATIPMRGIFIKDYPDLNLDIKAGSRYYYDKLREAKQKKEDTGSSGDSNFDALCNGMDSDNSNLWDHTTWDEFDNLSEAEQKLINKQVDTLLKQAADMTQKKRGTVPGELAAYLLSLDQIEKPKFDWKGYIRRFTGVSTKVYTKKIRRKENRRFSDNPGLKLKMRQHMLLAIDTSASVSDEELKEFMNEIHHIYKAGVDITIIQCDVIIQSINEYKGKFGGIAVAGRGGTAFDPVLEYYNAHLKKYTSLVYFTDGECYANVKPKSPVLWVISERSNMPEGLPGKVIKLEL